MILIALVTILIPQSQLIVIKLLFIGYFAYGIEVVKLLEAVLKLLGFTFLTLQGFAVFFNDLIGIFGGCYPVLFGSGVVICGLGRIKLIVGILIELMIFVNYFLIFITGFDQIIIR